MLRRRPRSTLFPTRRSSDLLILQETALSFLGLGLPPPTATWGNILAEGRDRLLVAPWIANLAGGAIILLRSEEHTSELQSQSNLVCRLLLEKKKNDKEVTIP